jgi:alpha-galactosidase
MSNMFKNPTILIKNLYEDRFARVSIIKSARPCHFLFSHFFRTAMAAVLFSPFITSLLAKDLTTGAPIVIETRNTELVLAVGPDQRLYQLAFGRRGSDWKIPEKFDRWNEFYPAWGNGYLGEPALQVTHADGGTATDLKYVKHEQTSVSDAVEVTRIDLRDEVYPFQVSIFIKAYINEDIIEQHVEMVHQESQKVLLERFASSSPIFLKGDPRLTQYVGQWAHEMNPVTTVLSNGIKVFDTRCVIRSHLFRNPSFFLTSGQEPKEDSGETFAGVLSWPGNFQFACAIESPQKSLRILSGMNPFGSSYRLAPGKKFVTPPMAWAYSAQGRGGLSRNMHSWAKKHIIREGDKTRDVLLNNWEATYMHFNEDKLVSLFDRAADVGMGLFLLDDGWFGRKYLRNDEKHGLGDWVADKEKLPSGISFLCDEAKKRGLRFGIWVEPEMANHFSELYDQHPEWMIQQKGREKSQERFQYTLDLTRPEVKEFAFKVVDDLLTENPGVSYIKWDCNRVINQPGSTWLGQEQSHLAIDYNNNLLEVFERLAKSHPKVEIMTCASGGGRTDYGTLRYCHELWPSDNTDPLKRVTMQWNYSNFYPAMIVAGHVTHSGNRPLKFAFDVAMSVRLGMDMDLSKLSESDLGFVRNSIRIYKERVAPLVQHGELYRTADPNISPRSVLTYVSPDKSTAVLFVLQKGPSQEMHAKAGGLDPGKMYAIEEINLPDGVKSRTMESGKVILGSELMQHGLMVPCVKECDSVLLYLKAMD